MRHGSCLSAGPERDDVLAALDPFAARQFQHQHLVELRDGGEVEAVEAFGSRKLRRLDAALDHAPFPVDQFEFDKAGKIADMIHALERALPGKLLVLAQEGRRLQRFEVMGKQEFGSIVAHAASSSSPSRRI